ALRAAPPSTSSGQALRKGALRSPPLEKEGQGGFHQQYHSWSRKRRGLWRSISRSRDSGTYMTCFPLVLLLSPFLHHIPAVGAEHLASHIGCLVRGQVEVGISDVDRSAKLAHGNTTKKVLHHLLGFSAGNITGHRRTFGLPLHSLHNVFDQTG